jgi:tRNA A37 threonylcarbamoyladenosine dehydratase
VGHLLICDFDRIEASNINRQVIANQETLGKLKVEVMQQKIKAINPDCEVIPYAVPYHNFLVSEHIDYVIDAIDDVAAKKMLISDCLSANINFISSMGAGNKLNPELVKIMNIRETTHDPLARIIRTHFRENSFKVVASTEETKRTPNQTMIGSYMPVVATFGLLASHYITHEILRRPL